jgi:hypothetical protein
MYKQYEGHVLPPAAAIQRQMETLGVAPKQTERARQTFSKSAQYAGFIDEGTGRFVKPAVGSTMNETADPNRSGKPGGGGGSGAGRRTAS